MAKSKPKPRRDTRVSGPAGITKGGRRHGCGGKIRCEETHRFYGNTAGAGTLTVDD